MPRVAVLGRSAHFGYVASPVSGRCTDYHPLCQDLWHRASAMARGASGTAPRKLRDLKIWNDAAG